MASYTKTLGGIGNAFLILLVIFIGSTWEGTLWQVRHHPLRLYFLVIIPPAILIYMYFGGMSLMLFVHTLYLAGLLLWLSRSGFREP